MSETGQAAMDPLARKALERLLKSADKQAAGVAQRRPALTGAALAAYRELRSLRDKESFEAVMAHGQAEGAIFVKRPRNDPLALIERIELLDVSKLASLLGEVPLSQRIETAKQVMAARVAEFPILLEVLSKWERLRKVRGTGPDAAADWVDACEVIGYCRTQVGAGATETPVRDASARLFRDSKRVEALLPCLDVILASSVDADARSEAEVLQELGLYREQQPARLAGNVVVRRERGVFPLDRPYCALPPSTVLGLGSAPRQLLTIENLTTFHVWARQNCDAEVLCIYTAGMPSPAWRGMYARLLSGLEIGTPVLHWGDVDEGGFRIAAVLSRCVADAGHTLLPMKMRPADVTESLRRAAPIRTVERMAKYARDAGWNGLAVELEHAKIVAEQEG